MEGTGGVRKLRWGRGARGKSGGVRVIYYVHSDLMPLYLRTLFTKMRRPISTKLSAMHWPDWLNCWFKSGWNLQRNIYNKRIR